MKSFDVYDRYDYDGDGNFNEPDGYIDHFQIVHAGGDQADGDPIYGEDAIWSHRWYANQIFNGTVGPAQNPVGGFQIGDTGIWIGDYTIQPENGGRSVFFHEYGHDLGLPDDYNVLSRRRQQQRALDPDGPEPPRRQERRRASASAPATSARGTSCSSAGSTTRPWQANQPQTLARSARQEYNSDKPQALVVTCPKKVVVTDSGAPASGHEAVVQR